MKLSNSMFTLESVHEHRQGEDNPCVFTCSCRYTFTANFDRAFIAKADLHFDELHPDWVLNYRNGEWAPYGIGPGKAA